MHGKTGSRPSMTVSHGITLSPRSQMTLYKSFADVEDRDYSAKEHWKVGDKCEVYSRLQRKWTQCKIIKMFQHQQTDCLVIQSKNGAIMEIERYSRFVRPIESIVVKWIIGDKCEIYDRQQGTWIASQIIKMFEYQGSDWLYVMRDDGSKLEIERHSDYIRPSLEMMRPIVKQVSSLTLYKETARDLLAGKVGDIIDSINHEIASSKHNFVYQVYHIAQHEEAEYKTSDTSPVISYITYNDKDAMDKYHEMVKRKYPTLGEYYMYTPCENLAKCGHGQDVLAMAYIFDGIEFECKSYLAIWENGVTQPEYSKSLGIWQFTYTNGEQCENGNDNNVFQIEWICDNSASDPRVVQAKQIAQCVYQMVINSILACT